MEPNRIRILGRGLSDATIRLHESIARVVGLSFTDHKHLYMIAEKGPLTAGQIATKTGFTTGAVTGLINRLETADLVRRIADKTDKRKVLVSVNRKKMAQLLGPQSARLEKRITALVGNYTRAEQRVIGQYLEQTIEVLHRLRMEIEAENG